MPSLAVVLLPARRELTGKRGWVSNFEDRTSRPYGSSEDGDNATADCAKLLPVFRVELNNKIRENVENIRKRG